MDISYLTASTIDQKGEGRLSIGGTRVFSNFYREIIEIGLGPHAKHKINIDGLKT